MIDLNFHSRSQLVAFRQKEDQFPCFQEHLAKVVLGQVATCNFKLNVVSEKHSFPRDLTQAASDSGWAVFDY